LLSELNEMTPMVLDRSQRRLGAVALLSVFLMLINALLPNYVSHDSYLPNSYIRRLNDQAEQGTTRPMMYTFVENYDYVQESKLYAWREAWRAAGWETKVLTLKDAKRHPHFEERDLALRAGNMRLGDAQILSFHRYMAISQAGGGWMSDWDILPLNPLKNGGHQISMPNEGRFTVYEIMGGGKGVVPSILSGTAKEYNRMAQLLFESAMEYGVKARSWSDLNALCDMYKKDPESFEVEDGVIPGRSVLTENSAHLVMDGQHWGKDDCLITNGKLAVHFTPVVLHGNLLREGDTRALASSIPLTWFDQWAGKCTDIVHFEDLDQ